MTRYEYYINGWRENRGYFLSLGRFTDMEMERLLNGGSITRGNNEFWIEVIEY